MKCITFKINDIRCIWTSTKISKSYTTFLLKLCKKHAGSFMNNYIIIIINDDTSASNIKKFMKIALK
jgi:hypothetical protein